MAHFLSAFNLFFWATATWWAPLLFIVGAWRMLVDREPVRYEPGYWSMVFPLGMYTACTWAYAEAAGVRFLKPIPEGFIFIAWTAWVLTMIGTLRALWRWWSSRKALH
jgi:tellurite resistance protein TehA-like permease